MAYQEFRKRGMHTWMNQDIWLRGNHDSVEMPKCRLIKVYDYVFKQGL